MGPRPISWVGSYPEVKPELKSWVRRGAAEGRDFETDKLRAGWREKDAARYGVVVVTTRGRTRPGMVEVGDGIRKGLATGESGT